MMVFMILNLATRKSKKLIAILLEKTIYFCLLNPKNKFGIWYNMLPRSKKIK